ncbi:MAG TPA: hypothetical protein VJ547_04280 [Candidatus Thermoplasmatota archaeon]|nr:hypothetical protein [Candidatus Thermoplasmatota archaeon]
MMEPRTRKYKTLEEIPEFPPEFLAEAERLARMYSEALKALSKY